MTERKLQLRCPKCGSDEIVEWSMVPTAYDIESVVRHEDGTIDIDYTGESNPEYDGAENDGYACRYYCEVATFSIDHYLVELDSTDSL